MDRIYRSTSDSRNVNFVELRAERGTGRILGCTACGPTASELINSMGIAITNKLTCIDVARSIHSYPSHGYLLHRIAMSMAFSSVWGLLESSGLIGNFLARIVRRLFIIQSNIKWIARHFIRRRKLTKEREWLANGAIMPLFVWDDNNTHSVEEHEHKTINENSKIRIISVLENYLNQEKNKGQDLPNEKMFPTSENQYEQWQRGRYNHNDDDDR
jgi:Pyridine nucleotide-disulphide oxidoreductase, dimerisation domain